jgi:hypothetical protein
MEEKGITMRPLGVGESFTTPRENIERLAGNGYVTVTYDEKTGKMLSMQLTRRFILAMSLAERLDIRLEEVEALIVGMDDAAVGRLLAAQSE